MKLRNTLGLALLCGVGLAQPALAEREFADIYTQCGIGAVIAPNNEAVAAVTNVTWDLGTTAISSNASSASSCKGGSAESAALIFQTLPELEKDLALGDGEHLSALVTVLRIAPANEEAYVLSLRARFAEVAAQDAYTNASRYDKAAAVHGLLRTRS